MLNFVYLNSLGFTIYIKSNLETMEKHFIFKKLTTTFEKRVPFTDIPSPNSRMFPFFENSLCREVLQELQKTYEPKEGVFVK